MSEERAVGDSPEERAATKAEIVSAAMILQGVVKASRAFGIYLPNNPLHEKFFEELRLNLEAHLEEFGPLRLDMEHDGIRCLGETVYTNPELRENIAFRMYADGIRALTFDEGLEPRELRTFIDIVARPVAEDAADDVVTQLWAADLPHLTYQLAEVPLAADNAALGLAEAGLPGARETQERAVRRYLSGIEAAPALPALLPAIAPQVFTLTEEELASLQERVAVEESCDPLQEVAGILEAILRVEADAAVFGEFAEIIGGICSDLLASGRVDQALRLLGTLNRVVAAPAAPRAHVERVVALRQEILTEESMTALAKLLSRGDGIERDVLRGLVLALGRAAVAPFCRILGEVPDKETRKVLVEVLSEAGREAPELLLPFLEDERWYLVRNTIYILRRIATPVAAGAVRRLIGHRDARVRKESLLYFDEVADPSAEAVMLKFLDDGVSALRISAARCLARRRSRAGQTRLLALIATPAFASRPLEEREAVFEALADLDPERMLAAFREMLQKRRWFGAAKELEEVACAAAGLRRLGTPAALAVLREAAAAKKGKALSLVEEAARAIQRSAAERRTAPEERPRG
jgi:hypothetical protein